ncbi:MAG: M24 family metallopeptidase [Longimicrobiales bacterium]
MSGGRISQTGGLLTTAPGVEAVQRRIASDGLDGWLLYDFKDRNPIARTLLGLEWTTRRAFAFIPAEGPPRLLIHAIEASSWRHLNWRKDTYASWAEMETGIDTLLEGASRVATETSDRSRVPYLDLLPAGIADVIKGTGVELVSSGDLVSAFYAVWTEDQRSEHAEASKIVKAVAKEAFERAADFVRRDELITEGALATWIRERLKAEGAPTQRDCIVAIGPKAADPHYDPGEVGEPIGRGDLLLIDLWGAMHDESVPADQTWMGYLGAELPDRFQELWTCVRDAREAAIAFLQAESATGRVLKGYEVDDVTRSVIREAGFGSYFIHRTGHSIDRDIHGRGPNIDNLEAQDDRVLLPGVGFSIEPGIYIADDVGIRTEVNVFMGPEGPEVTVADRQESVFLLLDE